jgi:UvrB/uvrC motif
VCGSELEAALEELRLIRELRPPANARSARPDRHVYLRRRGDGVVCSSKPSPIGPLKSRTRARLAARVLRAEELDRPELALPRLRRRLRDYVECRRFEDAARLRDRISALEHVIRTVERLERLKRTRCCLIVPGSEYPCGVFVANGRVADTRTLAGRVEVEAGLAACRIAGELELDELLLIDTFLRRPPPELRVAPLEADEILRLAAALPPALAAPARKPARARAA